MLGLEFIRVFLAFLVCGSVVCDLYWKSLVQRRPIGLLSSKYVHMQIKRQYVQCTTSVFTLVLV